LLSGQIIPVAYKIDDQPSIYENITLASNMYPNGYRDYPFTVPADLSAVDDYSFKAFCNFPNDINNANDTLSTVISHWGYPEVDLGLDTIYTSQADTVVLAADTGYASYSWNTGGTGQTLAIPNNDAKWYTVTVSSIYGCNTKDSTYLFTFDVGVVDISEPVNVCEATNAEYIRISVRNYGNTDIPSGTIIPLNYSINGGAVVSENYTLLSDLTSNSTVIYNFTTTFDMESVGTYDIEAYTTFNNDVDNSNDLYQKDVEVYGYPTIDIGADTIFTKQPDTVTLVANPGYASYLWNTGSSNDSLEITESHSQLYTVEVGSENGCDSYDSVFIYAFDLGVSEVLSPLSDCELEDDENISVRITNYSSDTLLAGQNINVAYTIDGGAQIMESLTLASDLLPSNSVDYTFSEEEEFSSTGDYIINAYTLWYQDVEGQNDMTIDTVMVYGFPSVDLGPDTTVRPRALQWQRYCSGM
jgi:hypothetical protein